MCQLLLWDRDLLRLVPSVGAISPFLLASQTPAVFSQIGILFLVLWDLAPTPSALLVQSAESSRASYRGRTIRFYRPADITRERQRITYFIVHHWAGQSLRFAWGLNLIGQAVFTT